MNGLFIAFEGGEGVGKSTQIARAAQWFRTRGRTVVETREPGGTSLGRHIRSLLLDPEYGSDGGSEHDIAPRAEALLYGADRAQHVATVVRPALVAGSVVLSDRYVDSTLAYQGAGRGLSVEQARVITDWATEGLLPDLTVLLDLEPSLGLARAVARSRPDRLESASLAFHEAVRAQFLELAAAAPQRYLVVSAAPDPDEVAAAVLAGLRTLVV